jgi:membrane protease YdiL (CAAX protease family)
VTARVTAAPRPALADAALAGGLAFLLVRPALGASPAALPLLAAGYLATTAAALAAGAGAAAGACGPAAGEGAAAAGAGRSAPLHWAVVLVVGLAAVAGSALVAGPVPDRRVGAAAGALGLLAAVAEEALFRRLLYARLLRLGTVAAVLGSAVAFALVHLPAYGTAALPVDLGAGLLLSWQRFASGRWTVPAVTHAAANLLAVT